VRAAISFGADAAATRGDLPPPPLRGRAGEGGSRVRRRLWLTPLPALLRSVGPSRGEGEEIAA
jgi:hypothetical protein